MVCLTDRPSHPAANISKDAGNGKALSLGRGLGEGGREPIQFGVDERSDGVLNDVQIGLGSDIVSVTVAG